MHEEASVAMAHGYAKIEGKPMACMFHATVGLQHASMAIYNAYCDRVPVFMMTGARIEADKRRSVVEWTTRADRRRRPWCATSPSGTTRPATLQGLRRKRRAGVEVRHDPALRADAAGRRHPDLQEDEIPGGALSTPRRFPACRHLRPPSGDANTVREVARLLVKRRASADLRRSLRAHAGGAADDGGAGGAPRRAGGG